MVPILTALWLSWGCKAELPQQLANDASGVFPCTVFADQLISYTPPGTEGGSELGLKTLGAPDDDGVVVATDAVLTVGFLGLGSIVDQPGKDIRVHGTLASGSEVAVYVGSSDAEGADSDYVFSGSLSPDDMDIDLSVATARTATSVQLVGIAGQATIDAFEALQTGCNN